MMSYLNNKEVTSLKMLLKSKNKTMGYIQEVQIELYTLNKREKILEINKLSQ